MEDAREIQTLFPEYLNEPAIDLGQLLGSRFRGLLSPVTHQRSTIGQDQVYDLEKSIKYHKRHYNPQGIRRLLERALQHFNPVACPKVLDIGSGSGNSIAAELQTLGGCEIVATDLSPHLLCIMKENLATEGLPEEKVNLICMDVQEPYFVPASFDMACGSAILHHLVDPRRAVVNVMNALKPEGAAVFFEPFEYGCVILKLLHNQILREAALRADASFQEGEPLEARLDDKVMNFLRDINHDYLLRSNVADGVKNFTHELDDKWLFTREFFEDIAKETGAKKVILYSNHEGMTETLFEDYIAQNFHLGRGWGRDVMPEWAWECAREFD